MKLSKKLASIGLAVAMVASIGATSVFAREIGSLTNFRIDSAFERTGYLNKNVAGNYVLNLEPSRELSGRKITHRLVNSNGQVRSYEGTLDCGQRGEYTNWATANFIYALEIKNENWWNSAIAITGSWSPDV